MVKTGLYLLLAFVLGATVAYGGSQLYPSQGGVDSQEWGVVVTTFGEGARLYGLFESRDTCLQSRSAFIEQYAAMAGSFVVKKDSRSVVLKTDKALATATFSCLPLNEIRGLALVTGSGS